MAELQQIRAVREARVILHDLEVAMQNIRDSSPFYAPGTGPTAADNCRKIFETVDKMLTYYVQCLTDEQK